ncbi:MAG: N-acetyl-gamma-glutamyl-phosphate reductase [Magnetococcales bacterium]|nr:N-acetyl-gamma-glutamyl-phosphate reductase [Magnetococcales bacterium]MBF0150451.1 N-acetyl-gamma-glutamyl-phosphate reductase [Magnetococcales bacterium]MBF0172758.1 N-acetyl-gamma-glutamyl-phosphate reductase [Magnetococcales bacterium]MBF0347486.1 N-acetyl-gamma-glutamyl-phosphate reductase [Magnetococcales bacterium]MBF0630051.1 N-acetyl-gamma-glutamyl-phosphate reductase [Magnetococcales bacterium]
MAITVGIQGASGYTGAELIRLLSAHPQVEIGFVTSERYAGQAMDRIFPHLSLRQDLVCRPLEDESGFASCQVVFCALPHETSMKVVPKLLRQGLKVVDLSADFRLRDPEVYREWYKVTHEAPELLPEAVYGLPEIYRDRIKGARLIANPGCYPTSVILALAPLLMDGGVIDTGSIVIDSKSGVSGAGRAPAENKLFAELAEGFRPYSTGFHRHTPEMEQIISDLLGREVRIRFAPHLLPQTRGILSTCHVRPLAGREGSDWQGRFEHFYRDAHFVRVMKPGMLPATNHVRASNYVHVAVVEDRRTGWLTILSTIDNLVKGAAGQAVQNMNIMFGLDEKMGLTQLPVFP